MAKATNKTLLTLLNRAKKFLKTDETMIEIFNKYDADIKFLDLIPTRFGKLDVSATTNKGVVILNEELLEEGNFADSYSYLVHEYSHFLQQCFRTKPTINKEDEDYLDNPHEEEAFSNQIKFIADTEGKEEAEEYTDDLLEYHELPNKEKKNKKEELMSKIK